jgi:hypothetical protein
VAQQSQTTWPPIHRAIQRSCLHVMTLVLICSIVSETGEVGRLSGRSRIYAGFMHGQYHDIWNRLCTTHAPRGCGVRCTYYVGTGVLVLMLPHACNSRIRPTLHVPTEAVDWSEEYVSEDPLYQIKEGSESSRKQSCSCSSLTPPN